MCFHTFQLTTSINPFFPLITFYINNNDRLTITCCINRCIYLCYCSRYGTVDRSTHKTICLSYQCTYLYLISPLYDRPCRCSNMLPQRKYCSLRQSRFFCRNISCQLMFLWVHTTYSECKQLHTFTSLPCDTTSVFTIFFNGKLIFTIAPVGHSSTHFVHRRHLL